MMSLMLVGCMALSLLVTAALAAQALAGWEDDLAEQIEREHDCKIAFLSRITERTVEGVCRQLILDNCGGLLRDGLVDVAALNQFSARECANYIKNAGYAST